MDKAQKLASILDRLQRNSSCEDTKLEAREFLRETPPEELMHLEERLARDGAPSEGMRHLCSAHLQVSNGERKAFRDSLPAGHMIAILMDEHELILANLDRLEGLVARLSAEVAVRQAHVPEDDRDVVQVFYFAGICLT